MDEAKPRDPGRTPAAQRIRQRDAFAARLGDATCGGFDLLTIWLGLELGFYAALARHGALPARELAARAGVQPRHAREWLEQQAVTGVLRVDDAAEAPLERVYSLPAAHAEVLLEPQSPAHRGALARLLVDLAAPLERVADAFRTGKPLARSDWSAEVRPVQGALHRSAFLERLGSEWLPAIADVHGRLLVDPPARVADLGCGVGFSCIGVARSYPKVAIDGFERDPAAVQIARAHVERAGLADRVRVFARDPADREVSGAYDLVLSLDFLHDAPDPAAVLETMRRVCAPGGTSLVAESAVRDDAIAGGSRFERMACAWSVLYGLPARAGGEAGDGDPRDGGAVLRPAVLARLARAAGFAGLVDLGLSAAPFRFYRLRA